MKILVGLSGGVDSATTAAILKKEGHEVIGITMSIWGDKKASSVKSVHNACLGPNEKEDIETAEQISKQLGIEHIVIDCSKEYDEIVLKNFKTEYLIGNTPNPCVRCNALVKFGVLLTLAKEKGIVFDKFATGHYARIIKDNGLFLLKQAKDKTKDQSYFLYKLTQEQLKDIIFPLGEYTKVEVRNIAKNFNLPIYDKNDSQDFYEGDYNELLNVDEKIGNIIDKNGNVLGTHKGIWNFTIGQRKGLKISSSKPLYVIELKSDTNEIVVGDIDDSFHKNIIAKDINYISKTFFDSNYSNKKFYKAKIRSGSKMSECLVNITNETLNVEFLEYQKAITKGQSIVIYDNEFVVAGGIIDKIY